MVKRTGHQASKSERRKRREERVDFLGLTGHTMQMKQCNIPYIEARALQKVVRPVGSVDCFIEAIT